ncbi:deleted in malignant brain tumors 1 protein-like [Lytechinus variegatus]|uniref:deleted in malignant brain tumors 1 protein-like n=1 Tax=Lytechinus variegatus TaxID=7654 RepID=UPI001BB1747F|nr:deleted in malignant brain tumors 1 protein-like [Lytechinus variegatus]
MRRNDKGIPEFKLNILPLVFERREVCAKLPKKSNSKNWKPFLFLCFSNSMEMPGLRRVYLLFVGIAVYCWYQTEAQTITDVRLVNGSNNAEGRVEVLYGGSWGTVCSRYGWDLLAARVVCRMLGFDGALAAPGSARFGQGTGDILYVSCEGTEESLADCYLDLEYGASYCRHNEVVGVIYYSQMSVTITSEYIFDYTKRDTAFSSKHPPFTWQLICEDCY